MRGGGGGGLQYLCFLEFPSVSDVWDLCFLDFIVLESKGSFFFVTLLYTAFLGLWYISKGLFYICGKLPTYPSPKPAFCFK